MVRRCLNCIMIRTSTWKCQDICLDQKNTLKKRTHPEAIHSITTLVLPLIFPFHPQMRERYLYLSHQVLSNSNRRHYLWINQLCIQFFIKVFSFYSVYYYYNPSLYASLLKNLWYSNRKLLGNHGEMDRITLSFKRRIITRLRLFIEKNHSLYLERH